MPATRCNLSRSWLALYVTTRSDTTGRQFPCRYCTLLHAGGSRHSPPLHLPPFGVSPPHRGRSLLGPREGSGRHSLGAAGCDWVLGSRLLGLGREPHHPRPTYLPQSGAPLCVPRGGVLNRVTAPRHPSSLLRRHPRPPQRPPLLGREPREETYQIGISHRVVVALLTTPQPAHTALSRSRLSGATEKNDRVPTPLHAACWCHCGRRSQSSKMSRSSGASGAMNQPTKASFTVARVCAGCIGGRMTGRPPPGLQERGVSLCECCARSVRSALFRIVTSGSEDSSRAPLPSGG